MADSAYDYFVSTFSSDPRVAAIERLKGVDYDYLLNEGVHLGVGDDFPEDAVFEVAEGSGDIVTDFISNISSNVIISERVKRFFQENGLTNEIVEYLPFKLKNKLGRIEADRYFYIANALLKIDCLDLKKSNCLINKRNKIVRVKVLEVDKSKIPDDAIFFRLSEEPSRILFRSDFVEKLKSSGFTGLSLCATGEELP